MSTYWRWLLGFMWVTALAQAIPAAIYGIWISVAIYIVPPILMTLIWGGGWFGALIYRRRERAKRAAEQALWEDRFRSTPPVQTVSELPEPGIEGRMVLLTTESHFYRDTGDEWVRVTTETDFTTRITDGAIRDHHITISGGSIAGDTISAPRWRLEDWRNSERPIIYSEQVAGNTVGVSRVYQDDAELTPSCEHIYTGLRRAGQRDPEPEQHYAVCGLCGVEVAVDAGRASEIANQLVEAQLAADRVTRRRSMPDQGVAISPCTLRGAHDWGISYVAASRVYERECRDCNYMQHLSFDDIQDNEPYASDEQLWRDVRAGDNGIVYAPRPTSTLPRTGSHQAEIDRLNEETERNKGRVQPGAPITKRRRLNLENDC